MYHSSIAGRVPPRGAIWNVHTRRSVPRIDIENANRRNNTAKAISLEITMNSVAKSK